MAARHLITWLATFQLVTCAFSWADGPGELIQAVRDQDKPAIRAAIPMSDYLFFRQVITDID